MTQQITARQQSNGNDRRIGLLAAWGRLPVLVAEELRRQGYHVSCLGVVGHADPHLKEICHDFQWVGWGSLGGAIRFFRRMGVRQATMAGKFQKVILYQPNLWWRHLPDWTFVKTFWHFLITKRRDRKDDTLLGTLTGAFADHGITFHPATDYAPELLVKPGQIAGRPPSASQLNDIQFAWEIAKQMGRLDIGPQGVELHRSLKDPIIENAVDLVYCAGPLFQGLWEALPSERRGGYAETSAALEADLLRDLRAGDVVMVKGSLGSKMGPIVKTLLRQFSSQGTREAVSAQG